MQIKRLIILLAAVCLALLVFACRPAERAPTAGEPPTPTRPRTPLPPIVGDPPTAEAPAGESALVTHVFDGDTVDVEIDGRTYRLRYIGIDSPEREEPFYEEAVELNRRLVDEQTVILVRDVSDTDQYGRLLRYVYLPDGTFVNAEMMSQGMARLVTFPPDVAQTEFLRGLQDQAREDGVGMWSRPDLTGPCDCDRNLYDCRDFRDRAEAQVCFDYCMDTTGRDVHWLDGGGDGQVCEFLP